MCQTDHVQQDSHGCINSDSFSDKKPSPVESLVVDSKKYVCTTRLKLCPDVVHQVTEHEKYHDCSG